MSNFGFERAMQQLEIDFVRTSVGDRYVMEQLKTLGWLLGGEASGHIVHLGLTTTGDAMVSALQVLRVMCETEQSLYELKLGMEKLPQVLINVGITQPFTVEKNKKIQIAVHKVEKKLGTSGRVLLRPSGTEPVIRVMVEGVDTHQVMLLAKELASVVEK